MKAPAAILLLGLLVTGCKWLGELAHMSPPRVLSYWPSSRQVSPASCDAVRLEFSAAMERTKTENAFSLSEEEELLRGGFQWQEDTLIFTPFRGFGANKHYTVSLAATAEDAYGNSLPQEFAFSFFTGLEETPPRIISFQPAAGQQIDQVRQAVVIVFSESVSQESFYRSFSLSPELQGSYQWNADSTQVCFVPREDYKPGEEYRVRIGTELEDLSGNKLAEDCFFCFTLGALEQQEILGCTTEDGRLTLLDLEASILNTGIEKDDAFRIELRQPVEAAQRSSLISLSPAVSQELTWSEEFRCCRLGFSEPLVYGRVYELKVLENTYRFRIDGPRSLPPQVEGLTYCPDASLGVFQPLTLNCLLAVEPGAVACFDFAIRHAPAAEIDRGAFLTALSISVENACLAIDQLSVQLSPVSPPPDPGAGEDTCIFRLTCILSPGLNPSGTVTFSLSTALRDSFGNHLSQPFTLMVNR